MIASFANANAHINPISSYFPPGSHNTSNSSMTAGQMLLAGFNGLFTKVAGELGSMLTCLKKIHLDHKEQIYDIMKEAQELQGPQVTCPQ